MLVVVVEFWVYCKIVVRSIEVLYKYDGGGGIEEYLFCNIKRINKNSMLDWFLL